MTGSEETHGGVGIGQLILDHDESATPDHVEFESVPLIAREGRGGRRDNHRLRGGVGPAHNRWLRQLNEAKVLRFPRLFLGAANQKNGLTNRLTNLGCGAEQGDQLAIGLVFDDAAGPPKSKAIRI